MTTKTALNTPQTFRDTYVEGEEFVDHAALTADLQSALDEMTAYAGGETRLRTVFIMEDGQRIGPEMLSTAKYRARRAELEAATEAQAKEYLVIYAWAGTNYSAYAPDVPGCIATGDTLEECRQLFAESLAFHLASMREDGEPLPEPTTVADTIRIALAA